MSGNSLPSEYDRLFSLRASDRAWTTARAEAPGPIVSSETLDKIADGFDNGARAFGVAAGVAAGVGRVDVAAAAAATAAIAREVAAVARARAEEARRQEEAAREAARERQAREREIRDAVDRSMHEFHEHLSRGDYRDPPSRERLSEIGHIA